MILRLLRNKGLARSNFTLISQFNRGKVRDDDDIHFKMVSYVNSDILSRLTYSAYILKMNIYQFSSSKNHRTKFSSSISSKNDLYQKINAINKLLNKNDLIHSLKYYKQITSYILQNFVQTVRDPLNNHKIQQFKQLFTKKYASNNSTQAKQFININNSILKQLQGRQDIDKVITKIYIMQTYNILLEQYFKKNKLDEGLIICEQSLKICQSCLVFNQIYQSYIQLKWKHMQMTFLKTKNSEQKFNKSIQLLEQIQHFQQNYLKNDFQEQSTQIIKQIKIVIFSELSKLVQQFKNWTQNISPEVVANKINNFLQKQFKNPTKELFFLYSSAKQLNFQLGNFQKCAQMLKKQRQIIKNTLNNDPQLMASNFFRQGYILSFKCIKKSSNEIQPKQIQLSINKLKKSLQIRQNEINSLKYNYQIVFAHIIISNFSLMHISLNPQNKKQNIKKMYQKAQQMIQKHKQNQHTIPQSANSLIYQMFSKSLEMTIKLLKGQGQCQYLLYKINKGKEILENRKDNPQINSLYQDLQIMSIELIFQAFQNDNSQQMIKLTNIYLNGTKDSKDITNNYMNVSPESKKQLIQIWFQWCLKLSQQNESQQNESYQNILQIYQKIVSLIKQWRIQSLHTVQKRILMLKMAAQYEYHGKIDKTVNLLIELSRQNQKDYFQNYIKEYIKNDNQQKYLKHLDNQLCLHDYIYKLYDQLKNSKDNEYNYFNLHTYLRINGKKIKQLQDELIKLGEQRGWDQNIQQVMFLNELKDNVNYKII